MSVYPFQSIQIFLSQHSSVRFNSHHNYRPLICAIFEGKELSSVLGYRAFWFKVLYVLKLELWPLCQNFSQFSKCSSNRSISWLILGIDVGTPQCIFPYRQIHIFSYSAVCGQRRNNKPRMWNSPLCITSYLVMSSNTWYCIFECVHIVDEDYGTLRLTFSRI